MQVGVGRHADRVAYDWRKLNRDEGKLFKGKSASIANWGRTNRVLVGPFDSQDAADAYAAKLKKGGHDDAFVWVSPEGQAVDPVPGEDGQ